jgi:hypothetical protein
VAAGRGRPRGEGCVFGFKTRAGEQRFGYKFTAQARDGRRQVLRRRDENGQPRLTRAYAAATLREAIVKAARAAGLSRAGSRPASTWQPGSPD